MKHTLELQIAIHFSGDDPEALQKDIDETVNDITHALGMPRVRVRSRIWWFTLEKAKESGKIVRSVSFRKPAGT